MKKRGKLAVNKKVSKAGDGLRQNFRQVEISGPGGAVLKQKLLNRQAAEETDFRGFLFLLYPCEAVSSV
jgi:hypothetical protein